jgi:hypothetical protein
VRGVAEDDRQASLSHRVHPYTGPTTRETRLWKVANRLIFFGRARVGLTRQPFRSPGASSPPCRACVSSGAPTQNPSQKCIEFGVRVGTCQHRSGALEPLVLRSAGDRNAFFPHASILGQSQVLSNEGRTFAN